VSRRGVYITPKDSRPSAIEWKRTETAKEVDRRSISRLSEKSVMVREDVMYR
jgi:hypothetical protein